MYFKVKNYLFLLLLRCDHSNHVKSDHSSSSKFWLERFYWLASICQLMIGQYYSLGS
jgi:hypothetical protein